MSVRTLSPTRRVNIFSETTTLTVPSPPKNVLRLPSASIIETESARHPPTIVGSGFFSSVFASIFASTAGDAASAAAAALSVKPGSAARGHDRPATTSPHASTAPTTANRVTSESHWERLFDSFNMAILLKTGVYSAECSASRFARWRRPSKHRSPSARPRELSPAMNLRRDAGLSENGPGTGQRRTPGTGTAD